MEGWRDQFVLTKCPDRNDQIQYVCLLERFVGYVSNATDPVQDGKEIKMTVPKNV